MEEYKPELHNIISSNEELLPTEDNSYKGCKKCDGGYLAPGKMCDCMKHEIKLRRYNNANIKYEYASLPLHEEEIEAYLKDDEHPDGKYPILLNPFIEDFVENAENYRKDGKGIIFNGPVGRGKSLAAMKILMFLNDKGYKCYFTTIKGFLELIKQSWTDEDAKHKLEYIYNADFVVMDDLGTELHKTDWTLTEIDSFFRHRYYEKLSTIITTNSNLDKLTEKYAQRIISLFQERSLVVPIVSKEDYRPKLGKVPNYTNKNKFIKGDK